MQQLPGRKPIRKLVKFQKAPLTLAADEAERRAVFNNRDSMINQMNDDGGSQKAAT